jgi:LuxR family maltose regulon positive regulatory protein
VLDWLARLPPQELDRRPRLLLAAPGRWPQRAARGGGAAGRAPAGAARADDSLRCECALILGGAAVFADDPDRFVALHEPWPEARRRCRHHAAADPRQPLALRALLEGEPALARLRQQQGPHAAGHAGNSSELPQALGRADHLPQLPVGRPGAAGRAAAAPGAGRCRRRPGPAQPLRRMLAALLAAALWERDQPAEAQALLANRLDVLERSGLPTA